jgi:hypothetical protein
MIKVKLHIERFVTCGRTGLLSLALASACSVATDVETADLEGFWVASQLRFSNPNNLNQTVDALSLGWGMTLQMNGDGTYTRVFLPPDAAAPDSLSGTFTVENGKDLTIVNADNTTGYGEVFLEGDQMALIFEELEGYEFDLSGTGQVVPATILAVLDR